MKYIKELREGDRIRGIYLCKTKRRAETKAGKPYEDLNLQDRTGNINAKLWTPDSPGISEYEEKDFVEIVGEVTTFNNSLQLNVQQLRVAREGEYSPEDYMPSTTKDVEGMYQELTEYIQSISNEYLQRAVSYYFLGNAAFKQAFQKSSAAKNMHHGFMGGLLEHTLCVVRLCEYFAQHYDIINRDLLLASAICHDIGKIRELSDFPDNDYTDEGQLLGHIIIGTEMIEEAIRSIPDFPPTLAREWKHCMLAHHGELEFGSPKKPALVEAVALNLADNADAKMQMLVEAFQNKNEQGWIGYNRVFGSNLRKTSL